MVTDPYANPTSAYKHKINFGYVYPSRWWFLKMFFTAQNGADYWYDRKHCGILIYSEEPQTHGPAGKVEDKVPHDWKTNRDPF